MLDWFAGYGWVFWSVLVYFYLSFLFHWIISAVSSRLNTDNNDRNQEIGSRFGKCLEDK